MPVKDAPFYGKCAYCESYIVDFQHVDIEHFRPKGGITDENDNQVILKDDLGNPTQDAMGEPKPHPGYYWLAYNWQNLLPSCTICNQPSSAGSKKIGKHNRFPVDGNHAQKPEDVESEQPLLINPASDREEDDPARHLAVDINTGLMIPLSERGKDPRRNNLGDLMFLRDTFSNLTEVCSHATIRSERRN